VVRWFAVKQTSKFNMSNANLRMPNANQSHSNQNLARQHNGKEQIDTATSSDTFPGTASSDTFCHCLQRLREEIV
jgi:hypothetical protein